LFLYRAGVGRNCAQGGADRRRVIVTLLQLRPDPFRRPADSKPAIALAT
jgi:hypothetical protein